RHWSLVVGQIPGDPIAGRHPRGQRKRFRIPLDRFAHSPVVGAKCLTNDQRQTTNDDFPMRIAYLNCISGISGDMFLDALMDTGVSPKLFEETVAALNIGAHLEILRVNRSGISATKVDVIVNGEKDSPRSSRTGVYDAHEPSASYRKDHEQPHH